MSILSTLKSMASNSIGAKVVKGVKNLFSGGSSNVAGAGMAFPVGQGLSAAQTIQANKAIAKAGGTSFGASGSWGAPVSSSGGGSAAPTTLSSGGAGGSVSRTSSGVSGSWAEPSSSFLLSPSVLSSSNPLSISAGSLATSTPGIVLPGTPGTSNYGPVNNAGLANENLKYNQATNALEPVVQTPQVVSPEEQAKIQADILKRELGLIPQKENILQSSEIVAQNAEVQKRQQEVNDYTAQLNSITAKQNQDLLQLEGVGAKEGVTEAVYGGQAATINREAAIRALPVQASLAAAQGNLGLAQDYLKNLTAIKTEQISNDYNYKLKVYDAITGYVDKEQERILDAKKTTTNQQFQMTLANMNDVHGYASSLLSTNPNAAGQLLALNPNSPSYVNDAQRIIGTVAPKTSGSTSPLSILDIQRYQDLYPNAGVQAGDSEAIANAKVTKSQSPEGTTKNLVVAAKNSGNDYQTVVKEIMSDDTIKDKAAAVKAADEVFGIDTHVIDGIASFFK